MENVIKKRNPIYSALLSIAVPGLGQLYNGHFKKGLILYVIWLLSNYMIMPIFNLQYTFIGVISIFILTITIYLVSIIDAIINSVKCKEYILQRFNRWYIYVLVITFTFAFPYILDKVSYIGVKSYSIPTSSMEPTIKYGDYIIVDLKYYRIHDPEPGDLIVFDYPPDPSISHIKRCIATGGQTIEIIDKIVHINGSKYSESSYVQHIDPNTMEKNTGFMNNQTYMNLGTRDNFGPLTIPENHYFVLGDNRDNSLDSRYYGLIPRENIYGKGLFVYFSWDYSENSIFNKIMWARLGLSIH